jgi:hypothetical protein
LSEHETLLFDESRVSSFHPDKCKMDTAEEKELIARIKEAISRSRGYADHFSWPLDRDLEEYGITQTFAKSLDANGQLFFKLESLKSRGRGNDPPDCEAEDLNGNRIGIEVTELVDPLTIEKLKNTGVYEWAEWDRVKLVRAIKQRLRAKDKPGKTKGGPYGNYVVVIHTDEPYLNEAFVTERLSGICFERARLVKRAFLLLSYDPAVKAYPYVELEFST